jgi:hypothetical protein
MQNLPGDTAGFVLSLILCVLLDIEGSATATCSFSSLLRAKTQIT